MKRIFLFLIAIFSIFFLPADDHKPGNMADIAKAMVSAGYEGRDALHLWLKSIWLMTDTIILKICWVWILCNPAKTTPLPAQLKELGCGGHEGW